MKDNLNKLAKEGILDIDQLSKEQQESLNQLLTDDDVNRLLDLNDRVKTDATLGPLSAITRSGG